MRSAGHYIRPPAFLKEMHNAGVSRSCKEMNRWAGVTVVVARPETETPT